MCICSCLTKGSKRSPRIWRRISSASPPLPEPLAALTSLPGSFALASYRASLLPLLGDPNESALQGATGELARLPLAFTAEDRLVKLDDAEVAAVSSAMLSPVDVGQTQTLSETAVDADAAPAPSSHDEQRKIA